MAENLDRLGDWLNPRPDGPILNPDVSMLTTLLCNAWNEIKGTEAESTHAYKLQGRVEKATWAKPIVTFQIERHAGTVMGSSRAAIHQWKINVANGIAHCNPQFGHTQIDPMDKSLTAKKLAQMAQEIVDLIDSQQEDSRIEWKNEAKTEVKVVISNVISAGDSQTTGARRKRFRKALEPILREHGWEAKSGHYYNTYIQTPRIIA